MLSQTAEYALRAVVILAANPDKPLKTQEISASGKIPPEYLSKVLQQLHKAGLVTATRGKAGGFKLARPGSRITLLEAVNAVDPVRRIRSCPLQLEAHASALCPLHRKLDDAYRHVEQALAASYASDLAGDLAPRVQLTTHA
jgi:Rrf2 family protein